jgi:hypothetical protein
MPVALNMAEEMLTVIGLSVDLSSELRHENFVPRLTPGA